MHTCVREMLRMFNYKLGSLCCEKFSIQEQLLRRNVQRFRGGLVFKAYRLVYHSSVGWKEIKKNEEEGYDLLRRAPLSSAHPTLVLVYQEKNV